MAAGPDILGEVNDGDRVSLCGGLFGGHLGQAVTTTYFAAYTAFFKAETSDLQKDLTDNHLGDSQHPLKDLALRTTTDLLAVVQKLRDHLDSTRSDVESCLAREVLGQNQHTADGLSRSLDLVLRLWLMIDFRDEKYADFTHSTPVQWKQTNTLREFAESLFPEAEWTPGHREGRMHPHFTAVNMENICGLVVKPTTSLVDHLRLEHRSLHLKDQRSILWVFQHPRILEAHLGDDRSPLPKQMLRETLMTLTLLFPPHDNETRKRYGQKHQLFETTICSEKERVRYLSAYPCWRNRLADLYDEVYQSPPASLRQLWYDRRNPQLFWTFWIGFSIALVTVFSFLTGVVAMIAGIIQTWFKI